MFMSSGLEKFIIGIATLFASLMLIYFFQPTHAECHAGVVVEVQNDLAEETYTVVINAEGKIVTSNVSAETYYAIEVGSTVEACEIIGEWLALGYNPKVRLAQ